ncbi:MAG: hypothetical protein IT336_05720 [Thermomicrobiales bacterium]|nr:hypothetical protein [Thermomicrobiales bacterium]
MTTLTLAAMAGLLIGAGQVSAAHPFGGRDRGDCLREAASGMRLTNTLDELVADGTITADQQTEIVEALDEGRVNRPFACNGIGVLRNGAVGDAVVQLLDMKRYEIRQAWRDGASLTEIAADQGVDRATLVDTMVSALDARLTEAVDEGTITAEQKAEIMESATVKIEEAVDFHRGDLRDQLESGTDDAAVTGTEVAMTIA